MQDLPLESYRIASISKLHWTGTMNARTGKGLLELLKSNQELKSLRLEFEGDHASLFERGLMRDLAEGLSRNKGLQSLYLMCYKPLTHSHHCILPLIRVLPQRADLEDLEIVVQLLDSSMDALAKYRQLSNCTLKTIHIEFYRESLTNVEKVASLLEAMNRSPRLKRVTFHTYLKSNNFPFAAAFKCSSATRFTQLRVSCSEDTTDSDQTKARVLELMEANERFESVRVDPFVTEDDDFRRGLDSLCARNRFNKAVNIAATAIQNGRLSLAALPLALDAAESECKEMGKGSHHHFATLLYSALLGSPSIQKIVEHSISTKQNHVEEE